MMMKALFLEYWDICSPFHYHVLGMIDHRPFHNLGAKGTVK